jgi:formylglycine-generating enzyme required for sulfatase activity
MWTAPWDDGFGTTAPVGRFEANAWGLYDMIGNAWEWCSDWYGAYAKDGVDDPQGPANGMDRVLRGGSWHSYPRSCRSAIRYWLDPGFRHDYFGFRVCLDLP